MILASLLFSCANPCANPSSFPDTLDSKATTSILVTTSRGDHKPTGDMTRLIEELYGFRAETMNLVVPNASVKFTSSPCALSASVITADIQTSGWQTHTAPVINEAVSVPFDFTLFGQTAAMGCERGVDVDLVGNAYADSIAKGLQEFLVANTELRILGKNAAGNRMESLRPAPQDVEFHCSFSPVGFDRSKQQTIVRMPIKGYPISVFSYSLTNGLSCSGKIDFDLKLDE